VILLTSFGSCSIATISHLRIIAAVVDEIEEPVLLALHHVGVAVVTRIVLVAIIRRKGTVFHTSNVVNGTQVDVSPLDGPL
jgi:hypothetical protein